MSVGNRHRTCQHKWIRQSAYIETFDCHLGVNCPIAIPPDFEPEPDCVIIAGSVDDAAFAVPTAADVECVIEISDSSLRRDQNFKRVLYAEAGIRNYIVMNLVGDTVEFHGVPVANQYTVNKVLHLGEQIDIPLRSGGVMTIPVASVLPARSLE